MSWKIAKLSEVCSKIGSGATPKGGSTVYIEKGTALIRSQNVYNLSFDYNGLVYINDEAAKKLNGVTIEENDVLINITGDSVARTCIVPAELLPARVNQHVAIVRPNGNVLNPYFLNYYLASPYMQSYMLGLAVGKGASRNAMTKDMIANFEVPCPSIEVQQNIVAILKSYDDLIENNQKQIKILEEAAQRLYKEWFVDLRFPGYEEVEIVDGMPVGWEKKAIGDAFITVLGGTPSRAKASYWNGDIPWINSGEVNSLRIVKESEFITEEGLKKSSTKLMPKHTTVLAITGATLGQVSYTEIETCANQSVVGIIDEQKKYSAYLYLFVSNNIWSMIGKATGGAQQHINKDIVNEYPIILPSEDTILKLNSVVEPMFLKMADLYFQSIKLVEARDRLLPKLMNGEIEV